MSKKSTLGLVGVFFLLLIVGGLVIFYNFILNKNKDVGNINDYSIQEINSRKIILNSRAKLKIKAPENWKVMKVNKERGSIILFNKALDIKSPEEILFPLKKGCIIEIAVVYKDMNFDDIKKELKKIHRGIGILAENFSEEKINTLNALKDEFDSKYLGKGVSFYVTKNKKVYSFTLYFAPDSFICKKEFFDFLKNNVEFH